MFSLQLSHQTIEYTIKKSARAKRMRITIKRNSALTVTIPKYVSYKAGEQFVQQKSTWIARILQTPSKSELLLPEVIDWKEHKGSALALVQTLITKYQEVYPYKYTSISINNPAGRWGSCSSKGRLNFNYRIKFLPSELAEYIVVHELCHLKQMNHSLRFWALVAKAFPNYQELRKTLRKIHY